MRLSGFVRSFRSDGATPWRLYLHDANQDQHNDKHTPSWFDLFNPTALREAVPRPSVQHVVRAGVGVGIDPDRGDVNLDAALSQSRPDVFVRLAPMAHFGGGVVPRIDVDERADRPARDGQFQVEIPGRRYRPRRCKFDTAIG